ncbi:MULTISPECIES: MarR family winged helix-turn-helix transcriptional regulator [Microbacterium]|uniref:MarR family winged helix-turn-helix transcriptional regulator n=1 Tax=Microbacterium TaxID=33882 RepID=UPI0006457D76|nr:MULTISPECIES: MarR family transcriptional regulator [Microbacterium]PKQ34745.1 MAG: MarR family transcriptional regulator [Actinobacteria bacterium HGW-Actinobacteria-11]MCE0509885.1 MarR family transcriptional regulator [Microbacterium sp. KKR3/1]MCK8468852.1 MarR family transcriptional regulator [Microbacterium aurugineum]QEA27487.1 MarR family transcriptional regulator [Microbacterium sp. CBA3102]TCJ21704.1 MarR family transcriptional regulator [Microbacterium sp. PI-1]
MTRPRPLPVDPLAEAKRQWIAHGWTDAADGMAVVTSVMRAQQLLLARVDAALKPFALSFARFEVLRLLAFSRAGRLPLSSVVARLQVHPTTVTSTAERLVRDGLVVREPHPHDGRAALLALTDAGRELVERATRSLNSEVFVDPGMSGDDAAELVAIVARLRKAAGDFADPRPHPEPL